MLNPSAGDLHGGGFARLTTLAGVLFRLVIAFSLLLALPACDSATLEPEGTAEAAREILLSAAALDMVEGDTLRLHAVLIGHSGLPIATPSSGQARKRASISWSTSDPDVVSIDANGLVRARKGGTAVLTATSGPLSSRAGAKVGGPKKQTPSKVLVSPEEETLTAIGSTAQLTATVLDGQGNPISNASVTWSSQNPAVASVDGSGKVTSRAVGLALITAISGSVADTATLQVRQDVAAVSVSPTSAVLAVGDSVRATAVATDANGTVVEGVRFAWSSSDATVATVSTGGVVRAVRAGVSMVTVATELHSASAAITVRESDVTTDANPFHGEKFYVWPDSPAWQAVRDWEKTRPEDAKQIEKIATQPKAQWYGEWNSNIHDTMLRQTSTIRAAGALPVYIIYNIPLRDCGQWAAGGASGGDAYRQWVHDFANGIGDRKAVVILEPDALGLLDCLTSAQQEERYTLLRDAIRILKGKPRIYVYVDAGHPRWHSASEISVRLTKAGIAEADGFALNISNYVGDAELIAYGEAVSKLTGGKRFVLDTGRNGLGPSDPPQWCNPLGRALGRRPTANTGHPLVDAFFWFKLPGGTDGACNGGPSSGFWRESTDANQNHALGLARRAAY